MIKVIYKNDYFSFKQDTENNIIFVNCLKGDIDDKTYEKYHKLILKVYSEHEKINLKFSLILDSSNLGINCISFGKKEAEFFHSLEDRTEKIVNCIVTITDSAVFKNSINFFIKLFGSVIPYKIVYDIDEAYKFINKVTNKNNELEIKC